MLPRHAVRISSSVGSFEHRISDEVKKAPPTLADEVQVQLRRRICDSMTQLLWFSTVSDVSLHVGPEVVKTNVQP